jgi:LacI family transcriptional regulator
MLAKSPIRRVGLLRDGMGHALASSILDYGRETDHWQFVGKGDTPLFEIDDLADLALDGIIGVFDDRVTVDAIATSGIKAVNVSTNADHPTLPLVGHDDQAIGRMGAEYLLGRGFRELAFFADTNEWLTHARLSAFREVIEDAGRPCHARTFAAGSVANFSVRDQVGRWLEELPKPIAIMTHMDYLARVTVNAAVRLGLRVPDDVAVLGVNNDRWTSILAMHSVSSIELDRHRQGLLAAETLDGLMAGGQPPPPRFIPPVGVVTRQSTDITLVEDEMVMSALSYIREHCTSGIIVEDVLDHVEVSRRNLELRMKRAVGMTPQVAIYRAQIERVKGMLSATGRPIESIARECGFSAPARLNEVFKRLTGMTPGQYRQQRSR